MHMTASGTNDLCTSAAGEIVGKEVCMSLALLCFSLNSLFSCEAAASDLAGCQLISLFVDVTACQYYECVCA